MNSAYACLFWDSSSFLEGEVIDVYKTTLGSFCMTARLNIELGSKLVWEFEIVVQDQGCGGFEGGRLLPCRQDKCNIWQGSVPHRDASWINWSGSCAITHTSWHEAGAIAIHALYNMLQWSCSEWTLVSHCGCIVREILLDWNQRRMEFQTSTWLCAWIQLEFLVECRLKHCAWFLMLLWFHTK